MDGLSPMMAEALRGVSRQDGSLQDTVPGPGSVGTARKAGKATSGGGRVAGHGGATPGGLAAAERLSAIQHEQDRDSSATVRCGTVAQHGTGLTPRWGLLCSANRILHKRQHSYYCRFMMLREMADRQRVKNQQEVTFGGESGPEVRTKKKRKKLRRRRPFLSRPGLTDEQKVEWLHSHSKVSDGQH